MSLPLFNDGPPGRVVVVGSAYSMTGRGLGSTIDAYDSVVRCNFHPTEGHEADVGTKTTHHAKGYGGPDAIPETGEYPDAREMWKIGNGPVNQPTPVWVHDLSVPSQPLLHQFRAWHEGVMPDIFKVQWPTTGLSTIALAITAVGYVDVIGFGLRDVFRAGYFWAPDLGVGAAHDYEVERVLINKWEQQGQLRRLDGDPLPHTEEVHE